jgi:hypothetical protein
MPPLTFWNGPGTRNKDYKFFDRQAGEYIRMGGTEFYIHKYLGPASSYGSTPDNEDNILAISDLVNLEIRDRKYDPDVYSLKGHYMITDTEFDLKQFGLFLSSDTTFITFHLNDMLEIMGRRLMSGDVIEVLHWRDTSTLDNKPINKFFVVEEGNKPAEGFSATWWPHLWRIKCQPLTDSQEYQDILNQALEDRGDGIDPSFTNPDGSAGTLGDLLSTYNKEIEINDAIVKEAADAVPFRNYQTAHFYILQKDIDAKPDVFCSDGIPPNDSKPVPSGTTFPGVYQKGDYFLRVDYVPPVLFRRGDNKWIKQETNYRSPWLPAGRVLASFINNKANTTYTDGTVAPERQNLRTAVKSKIDPDIE